MALQHVFRRDNILVAILVIAAILGVVGVPQNLGITADQLLLALLGVLALDTFIERVGYLERIEGKIKDIYNKMDPTQSLDAVFHARTDLPPFTLWLQQSEEIWLAGPSLSSLITTYGRQIVQAAKLGKQFRLLIANPDDTHLWDAMATGSFTYPSATALQQLAKGTLERAGRAAEDAPKGTIDIRVISYVFKSSYLIADGTKPHGKMIVEMFGYKISAGERLHMLLLRATDPNIFSFHLQQFESMWQDSKALQHLAPNPAAPADQKAPLPGR